MRMKHSPSLKLGSMELTRAQDLQNSNAWDLFTTMIKTYGFIIPYQGNNWKVSKASDTSVRIEAGAAILYNSEPRPVQLLAAQTITAPTGDNIYQLVLSYAEKNTETGTVSLTNSSASVTGVGTKFTEIFGPNRRIIVDNVPYSVLTVNSDTSLTLVTAFTGTSVSGKSFKCGGWFYGTPPAGVSDNYLYYYDDFTLTFKANGTKLPTDYTIADVLITGGQVDGITDKRSLSQFDVNVNYATLTGTPSSSFMVGGKYVLLEDDTPQPVLNFRVVDIYGLKPITDSAETGNISLGAYANKKLNVHLKWGYDIVGHGDGINTFHITDSVYSFTLNQFAGYYLYIPTLSKNLKITGNSAGTNGTISVTEVSGVDIDLTGVTITSGSPAWLHCNADKYELVAIPVYGEAGTELTDRLEEKAVMYSQSPVRQETALQLDSGTKYKIKIRAVRSNKQTSYLELGAGSYVKYSAAVNYSSPLLVKHVNIPTDGTIGAVPTRNGFQVTINNWSDAEAYEIAYTADNAGASFTNAQHAKRIITARTVDISTSSSQNFNIKVRPLIASQQVSAPLEKDVVSGSMAIPPEDRLIATVEIDHHTYSGSVTLNNGVCVLQGNALTPAIGSVTIAGLPPNINGAIITISDIDYLITKWLSSTTFAVAILTGGAGLPVNGTYTFTIGVTKRARLIAVNNLNMSYEINYAEFDCDVLDGTRVLLRFYQKDNETVADSIDIDGNDRAFPTPSDQIIDSSRGNLTLMVDLFDPEMNFNNGGLTGRLSIFGKPYNG